MDMDKEQQRELWAKVRNVQTMEELVAILEREGADYSEAEIKRLFEEIKYVAEQDGAGLSLDELEAVAGGVDRRSYWADGCAATVEPGSNCWGTDGGCTACNIYYYTRPVNAKCPNCGRWMYADMIYIHEDRSEEGVLTCPGCKTQQFVPVNVWRGLKDNEWS